MTFPRASGILLHPTSLPGPFGIGDLGDEAYTFADFLAASGQRLWQLLPQIERERAFCLKYLNTVGEEIHWDFIRAALASVADMALAPLQDVLGLGAEARMNLPNSTTGNWSWRFAKEALTAEVSGRLRALAELYGRTGGHS
jgi:4-alpha-glucanotransferase